MINYDFLYETNVLKKIGNVYWKQYYANISCVNRFLMQTSYKLEKIINHLTRQITFLFHSLPYEKLIIFKRKALLAIIFILLTTTN